MAKVKVSLWLNGPPIDVQARIHGTLKKFNCADLATEMDPSSIIYREIESDELNPLWQVNGKEIRMFSMAIDPTQLDYVMTAGCEPILDVGANALQVGEDEYDLTYSPTGSFTSAGLTSSAPDDWAICGHTKYYIKETVQADNLTWNYYIPAGWAQTSSQYNVLDYDYDNPGKYYVTNSPAAIDIYFNSNAHFGIGASNVPEQVGASGQCNMRRFFGPNMYTWRPGQPGLMGDMPGLWAAYWDYANSYPGMRVITASLLESVLNSSYATRYKYYAFAHQYDPDDTGTPETYIGFLFTAENALGQIIDANALIMTQDVASGVIKTPDGGEISGVEGGNGTYDDSSDNDDEDADGGQSVLVPWNNAQDVYDPGYNRYLLTPTQNDIQAFQNLCSGIWTPDAFEKLRNFIINPIDAILACHLIPQSLAPTITGSDGIKALGYYIDDIVQYTRTSVGTYGNMIAYKRIGTVPINFYNDAFPDYTSTIIQIHLPYIGVKQIDVANCMGGSITVDYYCDTLTGDCSAWVFVSDKEGNSKWLYEYKGNCARKIYLKSPSSGLDSVIPIIAGSMVGTAAGLIGETATLASAAMTGMREVVEGSPAFYAQQALQYAKQDAPYARINGVETASRAASIGTAMKSGCSSGAAASLSNGALGSVSTPTNGQCYLIIGRPQWNNPLHYAEQFGLPSDVGGTINMSSENAAFEGFLSVRSIKLNGIPATTEEKSEIERLMTNGVYVS